MRVKFNDEGCKRIVSPLLIDAILLAAVELKENGVRQKVDAFLSRLS